MDPADHDCHRPWCDQLSLRQVSAANDGNVARVGTGVVFDLLGTGDDTANSSLVPSRQRRITVSVALDYPRDRNLFIDCRLRLLLRNYTRAGSHLGHLTHQEIIDRDPVSIRRDSAQRSQLASESTLYREPDHRRDPA